MRLWDRNEDARELSRGGREVWVRLFNGRYAVSNMGHMQSSTRGEWAPMSPTVLPSGYLSVGIYTTRGCKPTTWLLHKLVVWSFDGPSEDLDRQDVRHVDNPDKSCNVLHNLAYGTRSENMLDVIRHRQSSMAPGPIEEEGDSWYVGYTADDYLVEVGLAFHAEGKLSIADLTRLWRCSAEVAGNIVHGETRQHIDRPTLPKKQLRRSAARKKEILALVEKGLNAEQINARLGETLTAQAVYYYRQRANR